jgi:hypothetical protein
MFVESLLIKIGTNNCAQQKLFAMAGGSVSIYIYLHNYDWSRWKDKFSETATANSQTLAVILFIKVNHT